MLVFPAGFANVSHEVFLMSLTLERLLRAAVLPHPVALCMLQETAEHVFRLTQITLLEAVFLHGGADLARLCP